MSLRIGEIYTCVFIENHTIYMSLRILKIRKATTFENYTIHMSLRILKFGKAKPLVKPLVIKMNCHKTLRKLIYRVGFDHKAL